jgi:hypothetical protein
MTPKDSFELNKSNNSNKFNNVAPFNFNFIPCTVNMNKTLMDIKTNASLRLSVLSHIQKSQANNVNNFRNESNNRVEINK